MLSSRRPWISAQDGPRARACSFDGAFHASLFCVSVTRGAAAIAQLTSEDKFEGWFPGRVRPRARKSGLVGAPPRHRLLLATRLRHSSLDCAVAALVRRPFYSSRACSMEILRVSILHAASPTNRPSPAHLRRHCYLFSRTLCIRLRRLRRRRILAARGQRTRLSSCTSCGLSPGSRGGWPCHSFF